MDDRERQRLEYVRDQIDRIQAITEPGMSRLEDDVDVRDAVLWRLLTLADAASHLPDETKDRHPEVAWNEVRGFRNLAAHAYLDLATPYISEIIQEDLPTLRQLTEDELARERDSGDQDRERGDDELSH